MVESVFKKHFVTWLLGGFMKVSNLILYLILFGNLLLRPNSVYSQSLEPVPQVKKIIIDFEQVGLEGSASNADQINFLKKIDFGIVCKVVELLKTQKGLEVFWLREDADSKSLDDRIKVANSKNGDIFLSVQCDFGDNLSIHETKLAFLNKDYSNVMEDQNPIDSQSALNTITGKLKNKRDKTWAELLTFFIASSIKKDTTQSVLPIAEMRNKELEELNMPFVRISFGSVLNEDYKEILMSSDWQDKIAKAIVSGTLSWRKEIEKSGVE